MINEIGTLRALPNGESLFVGSSSGVFFINTVRRAFSHAAAGASRRRSLNDDTNPLHASLPSPEECIFGPESYAEAAWSRPTGAPSDGDSVGELPSHTVAKELLMTYFRIWHPLLPFLHGPSCLEELEALYDGEADSQPRKPGSLSMAIILRCLFNIAKLDRPDLPPLGRSRIGSEEQLLFSLSTLSLKRDLTSMQALLAAQLYFVATMSLQAASTTGGLVLRSIFKSGLHRCPFRYSTFSADDRDMRKRVIWTAYTLDRYTSQSLGHPLGIQDSDIDVCPPGKIELHEPVFSNNRMEEGTSPEESILHLPANHPQRQACADSPQVRSQEESVHEHEEEQPIESQPSQNIEVESILQRRRRNQSVQAQFVRYSRLVGRMIEMFHKSIHVRSVRRQDILFLKADIDAWGNDMPYAGFAGPDPAMSPDARSSSLNQDLFFGVARQQLLLLVNRPSLSLEPNSAEFRHAIQICIGAARSIIRMLEAHFNLRETLFWPGFMSAVWMSGLVMVFACQLKLHSISNAISDISASLRILKAMTHRWSMAKNCHEVLSMLLDSIQNPATLQMPSNVQAQRNRSELPRSQDHPPPRGEKRSREEYPSDPSLEHEHRRLRLSRLNPQPLRASPAAGVGERGLPLPMTGFEGSQVRTLRYSTDSGHVETNDQMPATNMGMDSYFFPGQQQAEYSNGMLLPPMNRQSMPQLQQTQTFDSSTLPASRVNEWNVPPHFTPGFDPATLYDVFDGAMWGPLLELVEPNE